jgi:PAS domain S-box-containing protein
VLPEHGIIYWRERILLAVVGTAVLLSGLALVPALILALKERLWPLLILDCAALLLGIVLLVTRRIPYGVRAALVVMGFYGVGVSVIFNAGILSGGPVWIFTFGVMAGILLGLRAAFLAVFLNAVTLAALAFSFYSGIMDDSLPYYVSGLRAFTAGANFIALNLIVASAAAVMIRGIEFAAGKERETSRVLAEERNLLLEARSGLEKEVAYRTEAERIARQSELKYRLIAENVSDIIWIIDLASMRFDYISPSIERIRGYKPEEAMAMSMEETLSPASFLKVKEVLAWEISRDGEPGVDPYRSHTMEVELRKKDGTFGWFEVTVTFMRDEAGRPLKILGVSRDITERRRAEEERKKLEKRLQEARRMDAIATLAGGIAHQFNNALSIVGLNLEALQSASLTPDKRVKYLHNVGVAKERMAALTAQLLGYARGGRYQPRDMDASLLVSGAVELAADLVRPPVTLERDIPQGLGKVNADVTQMHMVISALIANAAEAIDGAGRITVSCRNIELTDDEPALDADLRPGVYVCIMVSDTGKGMDSETLSRIFEPFFTTKFQGRGLGMAAVYGIVKNHGGHIEVDSVPGRGTHVRIYLKASP